MLLHDLKRASFRGVPFLCPEDEMESGRNAVEHSFPDASHRYMEDNGRILPRYNITAILSEPGLPGKIKALTGALDRPGPGTLSHPWCGTRTVMVDGTYNIRRSDRHAGYVEIDICFAVTGGAIFPGLITGIPAAISGLASSLMTSVLGALSGGIPAPRSATSQQVVSGAIQAFGAALDASFGSSTDAGADIAARAGRMIGSPETLVALSLDALRGPFEDEFYTDAQIVSGFESVLETTLGLVDQAAVISPTTLDYVARQQALDLIGQTTSIAAFAGLCEGTANRSYATSQEVSVAESSLLSYYERICNFEAGVDAIGHEIALQLQRLVSEVSEVLRDAEVRLPRITEVNVESLPASVLMYSLYADDSRLQQSIDLNPNVNPVLYAGQILILEDPT